MRITAILWLVLALVVVSCSSGIEADESLDAVLQPDPDAMVGALTEVQAYVEACMTNAGFDYVAHVRSGANPGIDSLRASVTAGSDPAFTEESGYGIVKNHIFAVERLARDPNRAIRNGLEEADQQAYVRTFSDCIIEGQEEVGLNDLGAVSGQLFEMIEQLDRRILSDERILDLVGAWSSCMADAGHNYAQLTDPVDTLEVSAQELFDELALETHSHGAETHTHSDGEADHTHNDADPTVDTSVKALEAFEVEVALRDIGCRNEVGLIDVIESIREEYESEFLEENRELVDQYRETFP